MFSSYENNITVKDLGVEVSFACNVILEHGASLPRAHVFEPSHEIPKKIKYF